MRYVLPLTVFLFLAVCPLVGQEPGVRVIRVLATDRLVLETGDTVRTAFAEEPFQNDPDTVRGQFAEFLKAWMIVLASSRIWRVEHLACPDSAAGDSPAILSSSRSVPVIRLNEYLLEQGYAVFREECDTTGRAACFAASRAARKSRRGAYQSRKSMMPERTVIAADWYFPYRMASIQAIGNRTHFIAEFGRYYIITGPGQDNYDLTWATDDPGRKPAWYTWTRVEIQGRRWGWMVGVLYASDWATVPGLPIPLWGVRWGDMERCYWALDFALFVPVSMRFNYWLRHPVSKCWIGISPGVFMNSDNEGIAWQIGADLPLFPHILLKPQAIFPKELRGGFFRMGVGCAL